jgi:cardiolipin synthase A/B
VHASRAVVVFLLVASCGPPLDTSSGASSPVHVLVEPDAGPDAVLSLLSAARRSLWMEMYLLTDDAALEALVERRRAGVDVRVVLERHPFAAEGANDAAFDRLAAAGAVVAWASPRFALTHAKVAVVDGARLVVLTLNLTRAGLGGNREFVVVDDDPRDVAAAASLVAADLAGAPPSPSGTDRVVASPTESRAAIAGALASARRTVTAEMEELSDAAIVDALAAARGRGCDVAVVLPGSGRSGLTSAAAHRLAAAGVTVRAVDAPAIHAKALVADEWLYLGSANLTAGSLDANREVGLALDDPAARAVIGATITTDLARGHAP